MMPFLSTAKSATGALLTTWRSRASASRSACGGAARVGHVDHEAEHLALGRHGVDLGAEPALAAVGGDEAMLERALLAVAGDVAQERRGSARDRRDAAA